MNTTKQSFGSGRFIRVVLLGSLGLALGAGTAAAADNPGATPEDIGKATGLGALVGGGAHLLGAAGSKLINAANKGLARIALSPAEAARLRRSRSLSLEISASQPPSCFCECDYAMPLPGIG